MDKRGYQHRFSETNKTMFNKESRQRKAATMVSILSHYLEKPLNGLSVLNVGGSAGIIDEYLSRYFGHVTGIDIDETAIQHAKNNFNKENLSFEIGDAMNLKYQTSSFDVVICSQVYEHVPDAKIMMSEIYRVLNASGVVYFAAGNRIMINEPHYNLPLLSVLPRPISHIYVKYTGKADHYYEKHLTYWGLKKLVCDFEIIDFTQKILCEPQKYHAEYMLNTGSMKQKIAVFLSRYMIWLVPGYIWLLKKPEV